MAKQELVGAAVVVVQGGKTVALRGYGLANVERQIPVDPTRTLFRIGSISKALTLLTLSRLVDQERIDLHADVQEYFGPIDNPLQFTQPIAIEHLLTHTTGLDQIGTGRHIRQPELSLDKRKAMRPPLRDFLNSDNLRRVSPAGAFYRYDTYGTSLAGAIIEKVTGQPFAESMQQEMFEPLGMQRTFVEADDDHLPNLAMGYERVDGNNQAQPYEVYLTTPASSIDATAADMGRLLEALTGDGSNQHGRLFSAKMAQAVRRRQYRPHPEFPGVTHGLHESYDVSGQFERPIRSIDHGGVMAGFRSLLTILPDYELGVFVTTNTSGVSRRNELAAAVMRAIVDQLPPSPTRQPFTVPAPDPTRDLAEYEGVYSYGVFCHSCSPTEFAQGAWTPGPPIHVRVDHGALMIGDREFTTRGSDVFVRDDGMQKVFFGRGDEGATQFFTYSTSNDAFERVGPLPQREW